MMRAMQVMQVVTNLGLSVLAPARRGAPWIARTNGGAHDELRLLGTGATPEAAVEECARQWRALQ